MPLIPVSVNVSRTDIYMFNLVEVFTELIEKYELEIISLKYFSGDQAFDSYHKEYEPDYKAFYDSEINLRKLLTYPPFCDIYSVSFTSENENKSALCAKEFFDIFVELNKTEYKNEKFIVLGPSPAKISKISNNYRHRLAIKCKNSKSVRRMLNDILQKIAKMKEYKEVTVGIDLNPYDMN